LNKNIKLAFELGMLKAAEEQGLLKESGIFGTGLKTLWQNFGKTGLGRFLFTGAKGAREGSLMSHGVLKHLGSLTGFGGAPAGTLGSTLSAPLRLLPGMTREGAATSLGFGLFGSGINAMMAPEGQGWSTFYKTLLPSTLGSALAWHYVPLGARKLLSKGILGKTVGQGVTAKIPYSKLIGKMYKNPKRLGTYSKILTGKALGGIGAGFMLPMYLGTPAEHLAYKAFGVKPPSFEVPAYQRTAIPGALRYRRQYIGLQGAPVYQNRRLNFATQYQQQPYRSY